MGQRGAADGIVRPNTNGNNPSRSKPLDGGFSVENRDRLGVRKNDRFVEPGIIGPNDLCSRAATPTAT
jgi:hypothetical protein